ncbi:hypothetical protein [Planctomycetes bacterium TBK1r]
MLHPKRKRTPFRRSVRDADGNVLRTMEFAPNEAVRVTGDDLEAVRDDIGVSLVVMKIKPGTTEIAIDFDATAEISGRDIRDDLRQRKVKPFPLGDHNKPTKRRHFVGKTSIHFQGRNQ